MEKSDLNKALLEAFTNFSKDEKCTAEKLANSWAGIIDTYVKSMLTSLLAAGKPVPNDGGVGLLSSLALAVKTL